MKYSSAEASPEVKGAELILHLMKQGEPFPDALRIALKSLGVDWDEIQRNRMAHFDAARTFYEKLETNRTSLLSILVEAVLEIENEAKKDESRCHWCKKPATWRAECHTRSKAWDEFYCDVCKPMPKRIPMIWQPINENKNLENKLGYEKTKKTS